MHIKTINCHMYMYMYSMFCDIMYLPVMYIYTCMSVEKQYLTGMTERLDLSVKSCLITLFQCGIQYPLPSTLPVE